MRPRSRSFSVWNSHKDSAGRRASLHAPRHIVAAWLWLAVAVPAVAQAEWHGDSRPMLGTEVSVWLWHDDPAEAAGLIEAVFDETDRIDRLMSTYREDSAISEVNRRAAEEPVVAGEELATLIERALDVSVLTRGAFDITYDSVGQYYDFRERRRPDAGTLEREVEHIDYRLVEVDSVKSTIYFREPGVRINLGGIAKGYVVERGVDVLRRHGIEHAIVTAGGDSRLLGDRRGRPFMIGIRDPRKDGEVAISVPLEDEAISTSGDYERYFDEDGTRYHHIIAPGTGRPASGIHSATVVGPDAVITDALSTSVFVMGVDSGLRLIAGLPDYEAIVIDASGRIYYSDGLVEPDGGG